MISQTVKSNYERFIIMKRELLIDGAILKVYFSEASYKRFKKCSIDTQGSSFEIISNYLKAFKEAGFYNSKKFLTNFREYLRKVRNKLSDREYTGLMRKVKDKSEKRKIKIEYDHFPPEYLYRFAKDKHIRELRRSKRPGWFVKKGIHRKSVSTGSSSKSQAFRKQQSTLFGRGEYYESIRNYTLRYIQDSTINEENIEKFKKVLEDCANIDLIKKHQVSMLLDSLSQIFSKNIQTLKTSHTPTIISSAEHGQEKTL
jgi:hypothetical protein